MPLEPRMAAPACRAVLLLRRLRQGTNLIAADAQLDAISQLLELVGADLNDLAAEAEKAPNLDFYGLNLAVLPSLDVYDLAEVLVIGAENGRAAQARQCGPTGSDAGLSPGFRAPAIRLPPGQTAFEPSTFAARKAF